MVRLTAKQIEALKENRVKANLYPRPVPRSTVPSVSNLSPLVPKFKDQDVYIIGSGLSAYGLDWGVFDGETTVCINNTIKWFKNPSVHLFLDMPVLQQGGYPGANVPIVTKIGNYVSENANPVYKIRAGRKLNGNPEASGFYSAYSSTHIAIHLSHHLGAKRVILIGVEQMFMSREQITQLAKFTKDHPFYTDEAQTILETYDKLRAKDRGFGHWYSHLLPHGRDKHESSYKIAGDKMEPFYVYKNIFQMSPIHNTKFPRIDIR